MEVCHAFIVLSIGWSLMHHHHVGKREIPERIIGDQHLFQDMSQVAALGWFKVGDRRHTALRVDVHLKGITPEKRNKGGEVFPFDDYAATIPLLLSQDSAVQAAARVRLPVFSGRMQLLCGPGRNERVAVYLSMWMMKGHSDSFALVLKDEDVLNYINSTEIPVAVSPYLHKLADAPLSHFRE